MYNVEGKCNVWKSVGEVQDLPYYNETEIVLEKKAVRYAVAVRFFSAFLRTLQHTTVKLS